MTPWFTTSFAPSYKSQPPGFFQFSMMGFFEHFFWEAANPEIGRALGP
jgi:hypothetical protein